MHKKIVFIIFFLCINIVSIYAVSEDATIIHSVMHVMLQLGILVLMAQFGGIVARILHVPSIIGELLCGIVIGPYALGSIPVWGFETGMFPLSTGTFPISVELFSFATLASILLLFLAGLETDLDLFLRFALKGSIVGILGVLLPFVTGIIAIGIMLDLPFMAPEVLFFGVLLTPTSVSIGAKLLSNHQRMDSPEGVTILSGAIIDDIVGILLLSVVLGITLGGADIDGIQLDWIAIGLTTLKTLLVCFGFTTLGLLLSRHISRWLKHFGNVHTFTTIALSGALILAGIFEQAGLAMIIGAYVMGLALSKTDIVFVLQQQLKSIETFFVPMFFLITGMQINYLFLLDPSVILFGSLMSIIAIGGKLLGSGLPCLFLGFTPLGSLRVGLGMGPRGEVAFIIASIGLANQLLTGKILSIGIYTVVFSTIIASILFNAVLKLRGPSTRVVDAKSEKLQLNYSFDSSELSRMVTWRVITALEDEDFFVHRYSISNKDNYQIRKDLTFFSLERSQGELVFTSQKDDIPFIQMIMYEIVLTLSTDFSQMQESIKPQELVKDMQDAQVTGNYSKQQANFLASRLTVDNIMPYLKSTTKEEVLCELLDYAIYLGWISYEHMESIFTTLLEREAQMSTGMGDSIAIPHAKTPHIEKLYCLIGISLHDIDFGAIDNLPSRIFVLMLSPLEGHGAYLQLLSSMMQTLREESVRTQLLSQQHSRQDIHHILLSSN